MTTETTETTTENPEALENAGKAEPQTAEQPGAAQDGQPDTANREAAARRRQLREAEAERDTLRQQNVGLAERVEALQRREVERLAAETLAQPADLWAFGQNLQELLDEDGEVDEQVALAAIGALAASRPGTRRAEAGWSHSGYGYDGSAFSGSRGWKGVLSGR